MVREGGCFGWIILVVIVGAGNILTVTGQACSNNFPSVIPVKVCTNTVTTGSSVYMDFHDAKDHLSCTCSVTFTDSGILQVVPVVYPNYIGCGTVISISLTDTFRFNCKQSAGSDVNVLPGDVLSIQIDKERDHTTWNTNYCVVLSSKNNGFNFTVSCGNNVSAIATTATTATTTTKLSSASTIATTTTKLSSATTTATTTTKLSSATTTTVNTTTTTVKSSSQTIPSTSSAESPISSSSSSETTTALKDTAEDPQGSQSDMLIVAAGGGAGGVVLIVVCIIVIICCMRNRSKQKDKQSNVNTARAGDYQYDNMMIQSNENADDLPENVLYHSLVLPEANLRLSEVAQTNEKNDGNVYQSADTNLQTNSHIYLSTSSKPDMGVSQDNNAVKRDIGDSATAEGEQAPVPLYAVPDKKKSKVIESDNPEFPVYAMPIKKRTTNSQEISNPNPKPVIAKKPTKRPKRNVNEDGLQYADIELNRDSREAPKKSVNISSGSDVMYADINM